MVGHLVSLEATDQLGRLTAEHRPEDDLKAVVRSGVRGLRSGVDDQGQRSGSGAHGYGSENNGQGSVVRGQGLTVRGPWSGVRDLRLGVGDQGQGSDTYG